MLERISSYNLFNNLFPGAITVFILSKITTLNLIQSDFILGFFVYYCIGIFVGRVGSLVVEPLLKKIKFVSAINYTDYIQAIKINSKIEILNENSDVYRTLLAVTICIGMVKLSNIIGEKLPQYAIVDTYLLYVTIVIVLLFSYKKQVKYIKAFVEKTLEFGKENVSEK